MTPSSRASQFDKLFKVLRKYYKPVFPDPNLPVLDHLLRACCLENASYQAAETALAGLFHEFFDLNEIRVSTARELAEVMASLPDPAAAAQRIKRILQHVFEESYTFSLEELRKGTLGSAIERLQKIDGVSPFAVAYVVQSALGGHAIPIDSGTMEVLKILDLATDKEAASWQVSGLERAIPKSKGVEFGSLLHQLGADFTLNPYNPAVHEILTAVYPGAKDRLPKRRSGPAPGSLEMALGQEKTDVAPAAGDAAAACVGQTGQTAPQASSAQLPEQPPKTRGRKKKTAETKTESSSTPEPGTKTKGLSVPPSEGEKKPLSSKASSESLKDSSESVPSSSRQGGARETPPRHSKRSPSTAKLSKKKPR
ncbi:MAG TPA: hypothetical protein PLQ00_09630 [Thermoguttaceae bacterium]|nr:hypothetical protein [Thermoguttaceae bacterium]